MASGSERVPRHQHQPKWGGPNPSPWQKPQLRYSPPGQPSKNPQDRLYQDQAKAGGNSDVQPTTNNPDSEGRLYQDNLNDGWGPMNNAAAFEPKSQTPAAEFNYPANVPQQIGQLPPTPDLRRNLPIYDLFNNIPDFSNPHVPIWTHGYPTFNDIQNTGNVDFSLDLDPLKRYEDLAFPSNRLTFGDSFNATQGSSFDGTYQPYTQPNSILFQNIPTNSDGSSNNNSDWYNNFDQQLRQNHDSLQDQLLLQSPTSIAPSAGQMAVVGALGGAWIDEPTFLGIIGDTFVGMIPGIGELADVRDIYAHLWIMYKDGDWNNKLRWAGIAFSLIGLIPLAGGAIKGIARIILKYPIGTEVAQYLDEIVATIKRIKPEWLDIRKLEADFNASWSSGITATEGFLQDGLRAVAAKFSSDGSTELASRMGRFAEMSRTQLFQANQIIEREIDRVIQELKRLLGDTNGPNGGDLQPVGPFGDDFDSTLQRTHASQNNRPLRTQGGGGNVRHVEIPRAIQGRLGLNNARIIGGVAYADISVTMAVNLRQIRAVRRFFKSQGASSLIVETGVVVNKDLEERLAICRDTGEAFLGGIVRRSERHWRDYTIEFEL